MVFYDQLIPHDPDNNKYGDCFRAVIATLLQESIEEIPHFLEDNASNYDFMKRYSNFLLSRGFMFLNLNTFNMQEFKKSNLIDYPIYHEICDISPRFPSVFHSVVGLDGEVFYDPHPSKVGLPIVTENRTFGFLIKLPGAV